MISIAKSDGQSDFTITLRSFKPIWVYSVIANPLFNRPDNYSFYYFNF